MVNFGDNPERFYAQSKSDVNSDFVNRQKSVFEKLDAVVKDKEDSLVKQNNLKRNTCNEDRKVLKRQRFDTRQFLGQESIFKRPDAPLPSRFNRTVPDYKKHPQKWTKYSLSDVSEDDMSDQSNTAAAMSFLQEIKARKEAEEMEVESGRKTITFSKPSGNKKCNAANEDTFQSPIFRSSKVIMPEYVIGEKQSSKKNVRKSVGKTEKLKEIKLDHLEEEYDEES